MLTTYDLLAALAPWLATSLTELRVYRGFRVTAQNDRDEEQDVRHRNGPSATALPAGFTAMRHLAIGIDPLDWRTAYNIRDDDTRAVAHVILTQLLPNLVTLTISPVLFEAHESPFTEGQRYDLSYMEADPDDRRISAARGWYLRRQAMAEALLEATRAGRVPYLTSVRMPLKFEQEVVYEVATAAFATIGNRKITFFVPYTTQLVALGANDKTTANPPNPPPPPGSGPFPMHQD